MTIKRILEDGYSNLLDSDTANLEHRVAASSYKIRNSYEIENGYLKFSCNAELLEVTPSRGMLEDFVSLSNASDEKIRRFTCKYGILHLCKDHSMPAGHNPQCKPIMMWREEVGVRVEENTFKKGELLKDWKKYANFARALLNVSANLHDEKLGDIKDWEILQKHYLPGGNYADSDSNEEKISREKFYVGLGVHHWLTIADVRPVFIWENQSPEITFESNNAYGKLFGNLAIQLMMSISQTKGLALCSSCGKPYSPKRRPRAGERHYCSRNYCGRKAANRDAQSASRKRKSEENL